MIVVSFSINMSVFVFVMNKNKDGKTNMESMPIERQWQSQQINQANKKKKAHKQTK